MTGQLGELPHVDEHVVEVVAGPEAVWMAVTGTISRSFSGRYVEWLTQLLGCTPATASDSWRPATGCSLAGFWVDVAEPPTLITLTGRHRFSQYALIFRIDETNSGAQCRVESRARFPGCRGRLYRIAVIFSQGHRILVRKMLRNIKHVAERAPSVG